MSFVAVSGEATVVFCTLRYISFIFIRSSEIQISSHFFVLRFALSLSQFFLSFRFIFNRTKENNLAETTNEINDVGFFFRSFFASHSLHEPFSVVYFVAFARTPSNNLYQNNFLWYFFTFYLVNFDVKLPSSNCITILLTIGFNFVENWMKNK